MISTTFFFVLPARDSLCINFSLMEHSAFFWHWDTWVWCDHIKWHLNGSLIDFHSSKSFFKSLEFWTYASCFSASGFDVSVKILQILYVRLSIHLLLLFQKVFLWTFMSRYICHQTGALPFVFEVVHVNLHTS